VSAVSFEQSNCLRVTAEAVGATTVLTPHGILDSTTYRSMRDQIIKAALDEPDAVIVDVTDLAVPTDSALAVFTSARWHVGRWPEVPIVLVCGHPARRSALIRNGVSRYVPVYPTTDRALEDLLRSRAPTCRHRARADLPASLASLQRSRELVEEWLTAWSHTDLIPVAKIIVTTLVENVLEHTDSRPNVRLETNGTTVTVAVSDANPALAVPHESSGLDHSTSGLQILSALCRVWGNAPTPAGKTVWSVIGPENRL
jgi:anti-anti-sigma regulatory factor